MKASEVLRTGRSLNRRREAIHAAILELFGELHDQNRVLSGQSGAFNVR
jgi:hypothetical protein